MRTDLEVTDVAATRIMGLLGGPAVLPGRIDTALDTHDLLQAGLPGLSLDHLIGSVGLLRDHDLIERALGISERTYYRRKKGSARKPLSREQSGRVWKFAEILATATELFGSQSEAERWLEQPAIGLDQRRPIDLLSTPAGVATVETYLTRIAYGVYT